MKDKGIQILPTTAIPQKIKLSDQVFKPAWNVQQNPIRENGGWLLINFVIL